jgi:hypothetical protein
MGTPIIEDTFLENLFFLKKVISIWKDEQKTSWKIFSRTYGPEKSLAIDGLL